MDSRCIAGNWWLPVVSVTCSVHTLFWLQVITWNGKQCCSCSSTASRSCSCPCSSTALNGWQLVCFPKRGQISSGSQIVFYRCYILCCMILKYETAKPWPKFVMIIYNFITVVNRESKSVSGMYWYVTPHERSKKSHIKNLWSNIKNSWHSKI